MVSMEQVGRRGWGWPRTLPAVAVWRVLTVAFALGATVSEAAFKEPIQAPNVIVIVADDLGYGDIGAYGQQHFRTPRLDQFAAEGMRFSQFYAGSSVGTASRGSLLTGLHTGHSRIRGKGKSALASMDTTLGELAKQAEYRTGAIGKWGLGGPGSSGIPTVQGFDVWFGYLDDGSVTNHYPVTLWRNQTNIFWPENSYGKQAKYAPYLFTQAATNFVAQNRRHPFFLYVAFTLPHSPLQSPTDKPYQSKHWPKPQKTLAAMIYRLDRSVGRILDTLKHYQLDEKTIVFFTSDNGPHADEGINPKFFDSTDGLRGHKGDLFEGGIRVPLLARWPGYVKAGATSEHICAAWDLFPTAANLMGIKEFGQIDGISLMPELLRRRQPRHPYLYWESHGESGFAQAIRKGDWKGVRLGQGQPLQLFHLRRDPGETTDVSGRYRRTVRRLERYLSRARTESDDWPISSTPDG
ncbi:MAG: Arylsulfatase [Verrucomicrobia subdivision 3 bacterium]|nr:Arylsulfatase [Limisphaerales bacterium]MCS1414701.1 Arylsulfatase [Limisphaerales bacterium]